MLLRGFQSDTLSNYKSYSEEIPLVTWLFRAKIAGRSLTFPAAIGTAIIRFGNNSNNKPKLLSTKQEN